MCLDYKFLPILLLLNSFSSYGQTGFEKIELMTDMGCVYAEYTTPSRTELRKKSIVTWSGICLNGYISGFGVLQINAADGAQTTITGNYKNGLEDGQGQFVQITDKGKTIFNGFYKDGFRVKGNFESQNLNGEGYKYSGEFSNGKFHGFGKLENSNYIYEGQFKNGLLQGKGKFKYADGRIYEGDVLAGKSHGQGMSKYSNGDIYEGSFLDGNREGKGIYYKNGNQISGNFVKGTLEGYGKFLAKDGTTYEGNFRNSLPDGIGVWKYADGSTYEGNNSNGKINGYGIYKNALGGSAEGDWVDAKMIGKFKLTNKNGDVTQANYVDGVLDGIAISTKANGDKFYLEFKSGVKVSETAASTNNKSSQAQSSNTVESEFAQAKKRQKGIDSLNCEAYAKNNTANQQTMSPPGQTGFAVFASIFAQATLIDMNKQEFYDSCMMRLGH